MPAAKLRGFSSPDTMMSEQKGGKPEEGNDSLDNFIRQAIGKEPFLSFSRAGDSPVQWIQLLHALDQQGTNKLSKGPKVNNTIEGKKHHLEHCNGVGSYSYDTSGIKDSVHPIKRSGVPVEGTKSASEHLQTLKIPEAVVAFAQAAARANDLPGWPLLSPSKVPMQKCEKCSREFCSPINYRRHIRVHRRSLNIDKDSPKNRDILGAFWDKLSLDDAKEIVSFKNVMLEEVPGSSIIRALTSLVRKPGFSSLPQVHVKAGAALLDVVQGRPSRFPISSQELFSILDDASEKTFLCAGTALSLQKFVFDGEAAKIGLEMKNLVACTSFLVEQKLVIAWLADKDAEALRCQKLLVEEEEAAQRRQAELLERRRLKKLRQKEQKSRDQTDGDKEDSRDGSPDNLDEIVSSTGKINQEAAFDIHSQEGQIDPVLPYLEPVRHLKPDVEADIGGQTGFTDPDIEMGYGDVSTANCQNVDQKTQQGGSRRQPIVARRQLLKPQRNISNGLHSGQNVLKSGGVQKHGVYRDQRTASLANGHKVWTRKTKSEAEGEVLNSRLQRELVDQSDQNDNCEVLIGSISVTLGDCGSQRQGETATAAVDQCTAEPPPKRSHILEKLIKADSCQGGTNRLMVKLWRPVGRYEAGGSTNIQGDKREDEADMISCPFTNRNPSSESYLSHGVMNDSSSGSRNDSPMLLEDNADSRGLTLFSSRAAEAFLAQRWKEAIASDHVKLVLCLENEPSGCLENHDDALPPAQFVSNGCERSILGNAENRLVGVGLEPSTTGAAKTKFKGKPEKGYRLKYIPKQRNCT
ncbi:uncharacterized protein LOC122071282 isoform X2 [Macadamia integrifolia]|uniref:uncharacterized protein LOC122071282 isoform X2 n=1 Tax=Macadamia integrifolia TaxID=60698 RepID=UPI001C4E4C7B|nr:uncharacterized protein LOC122071282 isoform X2 [Macadamia integrifolia]